MKKSGGKTVRSSLKNFESGLLMSLILSKSSFVCEVKQNVTKVNNGLVFVL